ncbi:hypothetical protein ES703_112882 [subsurface metagenome]
MPMKIGVDVTDVNGSLYDILPIVECCVTACGGEGYITTLTSEKKDDSVADRRNVLIVDIKRAQNVSLVQRRLKVWLGPNYNIVKDHGMIKIEWDPKREKGNEKW